MSEDKISRRVAVGRSRKNPLRWKLAYRKFVREHSPIHTCGGVQEEGLGWRRTRANRDAVATKASAIAPGSSAAGMSFLSPSAHSVGLAGPL